MLVGLCVIDAMGMWFFLEFLNSSVRMWARMGHVRSRFEVRMVTLIATRSPGNELNAL